jgi:nitrogen regulatory protein PII
MKLVVAYVDAVEYESLREELLSLGIPTLSVTDVTASLPEATVSASYRGTAIESHTRPKVRAECVVVDKLVPTVVEAVLKREGKGAFTFVVPVEQAQPESYVATGLPAVEGVA